MTTFSNSLNSKVRLCICEKEGEKVGRRLKNRKKTMKTVHTPDGLLILNKDDRNTWEPWANLLTPEVQSEAKAVKEAALPRTPGSRGMRLA